MRILAWHVHGSWMDAFVRGPHTYVLPASDSSGDWGIGRAGRDWPASAREVPGSRLRDEDPELVVLQRPEELGLVTELTGRTPGIDLPAIYLEHNTPPHPADSRHPLADQSRIPIIHVTQFNRLAWDTGSAPTSVIEHGVREPKAQYWPRKRVLAAVINEAARRGRPVGADLLPAFARAAPVHLFGIASEAAARRDADGQAMVIGRGDLPREQLHRQMADCGVYVHLARWTSLGLSLIEAMMIGMPIVALATTAAATVVRPEHGATGHDVDALVRAARTLVAEPTLARRCGAAARRTAIARFGLTRFLDDWERTIGALVAGQLSFPSRSADERSA